MCTSVIRWIWVLSEEFQCFPQNLTISNIPDLGKMADHSSLSAQCQHRRDHCLCPGIFVSLFFGHVHTKLCTCSTNSTIHKLGREARCKPEFHSHTHCRKWRLKMWNTIFDTSTLYTVVCTWPLKRTYWALDTKSESTGYILGTYQIITIKCLVLIGYLTGSAQKGTLPDKYWYTSRTMFAYMYVLGL